MRLNDWHREAERFEDMDRAFSHEGDDGPEDEPVTPPASYGPFYPPEPTPETVTCSPCCGAEVVERGIEDESLSTCSECERLCEGATVEVPVAVWEQGSDVTLAWIEAHQGGAA